MAVKKHGPLYHVAIFVVAYFVGKYLLGPVVWWVYDRMVEFGTWYCHIPW